MFPNRNTLALIFKTITFMEMPPRYKKLTICSHNAFNSKIPVERYRKNKNTSSMIVDTQGTAPEVKSVSGTVTVTCSLHQAYHKKGSLQSTVYHLQS